MTVLRLALVLFALAGTTACGVSRAKPYDTPAHVAALIRAKWGSTATERGCRLDSSAIRVASVLATSLKARY